MKLAEIQEKLRHAGLKIFSRRELVRLLGDSPVSVQKILQRYTQRGILARLKAGLYAFRLNFPSSYLIANKLYKPSYISFETALSYYNLIPEAIFEFTSATTKAIRKFNTGNQIFTYHKIKKRAFTGYKLTRIDDENVLFADKEKALADYLYHVFLKKRSFNDRLRSRGLDHKKLKFYLSLFEKPKFLKWALNVIRTAA